MKKLMAQIGDIRGGSANDDPKWMTVYNGSLYFSAVSPAGFSKLYKLTAPVQP